MQVTKLIFMQTGTYNDMAARPYQTQMDADTVSQFQQATEGGNNFSVSAVSGVAGNLLRPKAQPNNFAFISNGWDAPRFRFMMEVEHQNQLGGSTTQILSGYTDHVGVSYGGHIDPNMILYFNTTMTIRNVVENTPTGRVKRSNIADASHLIAKQAEDPNMGFGQPAFTHSMRPEDVFCNMELATLGGEQDVMDMRPTFQTGIKKSRRSNGAAPTYISRVMEAHKNAVQNEDDYSLTHENLMSSARGNVREGLPAQDPFLSYMGKVSQLQENGCLTYGDLVSMDPSLNETMDPRVKVIMPGETHQTSMHQRGQTEYWTTSTIETVAATILSHSVPSIMMDLMLTQVYFMATNETYGGEYEVRVLGAHGFNENIDLTPYLERFINRIKVEILRDLSRNSSIAISITMQVDVLGETYIQISMNNQPAVDYVTPSFCDALMTPVVTQHQQDLHTLASDIDTLMSNTEPSVPHPNFTLGGMDNGDHSVI